MRNNPFVKLARLDAPTGYLLLWIPILWASFASKSIWGVSYADIFYIIAITFIGAVVMRGAGCTWNDIVDKDFDKKVERTKNRPLANGTIKLRYAYGFIGVQLLIGLAVLSLLPPPAQIAALLSVIPATLYPFMKRYTYWPQAWLGIVFNWGIWVGWLSFSTENLIIPFIMHLGAMAWTIGYDTIYAHMDTEDDILVGVKSTALKFGKNTKIWLAGLCSFCVAMLCLVGIIAKLNIAFYLVMGVVAISFFYQVKTLNVNNSKLCLKLFKQSYKIGFTIAIAFLLGTI